VSDHVVETEAYRLELRADGLSASFAAGGEHLADLRPLAAVDAVAGPDETLSVDAPVALEAERGFRVERRSTIWERAGVDVVCGDATVELRPWVVGAGAVTDVHLLAFRSLVPGQPLGFMPSGRRFRSLYSPNPGDPRRVVRPAGESAVIGVSGDGTPGRTHWFFTPAPLLLAFARDELRDPVETDSGWLALGIEAPVGELGFVQLEYVPGEGSFGLRLEYDGHTRVDGELRLPALVLSPGHATPLDALREQRARLSSRGLAPAAAARERPAWWSEPIFCGWGAQCDLARGSGRFAGEFATQENYDLFLEQLEAEGVAPGIVTLDDKWQDGYGTNRPNAAKWPDLRGWIARQHERDRRILLWWKAWDPEGLPPELCVRNAAGTPVAFDPSNPDACAALRAQVHAMLAPDGLDADGFKVDFTARTPSGRALTAHGDGWGIALLHELLRVLYDATKEVKPDALVITHTPHPSFVDVTDMVRLNDIVRTDDDDPRGRVVAQMRRRAEVVQAACPEVLVDTDDWCMPNLAEWREYAEEKHLLGVPSLYYARAVDATGETFEARDYATLRRTWDAWRRSR